MADQLTQVLAGTVALITADRRAGELGAALERRGASVRQVPVLSLVPNSDDRQLIEMTDALLADPPDIVVVTTGVGFRGWIEAADSHGLADALTAILDRARLIARGPKAHGAILAAGLETEWVASSETAAEIIEVLTRHGVAGMHIAVQHHGAGSDGLDEALSAAGARVTSLVVYRWGPAPDPPSVTASVHEVAAGLIDTVCFTSAPGVHAWLGVARECGLLDIIRDRCLAGEVVAAPVGSVTAAPLVNAGIPALIPDRGRLGSLVRAIVSHYESQECAGLETSAGVLVVHRTAAVLDGQVLGLSPSGLEVLRLLATAGGGVVTRRQMLDALPGESQDEHAAEVAVARLRDAVGSPGLIRTVVKRGYRLDVPPAGASTA